MLYILLHIKSKFMKILIKAILLIFTLLNIIILKKIVSSLKEKKELNSAEIKENQC